MVCGIKIYQVFSIIGAALCFLVSGCMVEYYELEHAPTKIFLKGVSKEDIEGGEEYSLDGVLFVPFFNKLTVSYPVPESYMRIYSLDEKDVKIEKAILSFGGEIYALELDKEVRLKKNEEGYFSGGVKLFDGSKFDVSRLSKGDVVKLEVYVAVNARREKLTYFLDLVKYRGIDWPT